MSPRTPWPSGSPRGARLARWLEAVSWGFALLGAALPWAYGAGPLGLHREALARWSGAGARGPHPGALGLLVAITGGSIAGKWVAHALLARHGLARGERWAADLSLLGLALWFVGDSGASLALGASFNVWMVNLTPWLFFGLPLWLGRAEFNRPLEEGAPTERSLPRRVATAAMALGAASGLAIALLGDTALFDPWFRGLSQAHFGGRPLTALERREVLFWFGPVGGCVLAQFTLLAVILWRAGGARWAWRAALGSVLAWFVLDTAVGLARGGAFNVWRVNLPSLALCVPPLAALAVSVERRARAGQTPRP